MKITILLTAWNRPALLNKAIRSIEAQTHQDWRCRILDDGSDQDTIDLYRAVQDERIQVYYYVPTPRERARTTRYSVNINRHLPNIGQGLVCYMTDNTEYHPDCLATVAAWFDEHPLAFSGYVISDRDCYTSDGEYLGTAAEYRHWEHMPDQLVPYQHDITGHLDHSQVFHRIPVAMEWDESIGAKSHGDALFYNRLIKAHGPLFPIAPVPLLTEHIVE